jgi:hypothetical protein
MCSDTVRFYVYAGFREYQYSVTRFLRPSSQVCKWGAALHGFSLVFLKPPVGVNNHDDSDQSDLIANRLWQAPYTYYVDFC